MNTNEAIKQLKEEGFQDITVSPHEPNMDFPEHTHDYLTVHLIIDGELLLHEADGAKTYTAGDRVEIPAGTTHHASCGPSGCIFVVGVKR